MIFKLNIIFHGDLSSIIVTVSEGSVKSLDRTTVCIEEKSLLTEDTGGLLARIEGNTLTGK